MRYARSSPPVPRFLYATGMCSGQASQLAWDMVDAKVTELHVPGELTKNGETSHFTLPLLYRDGTPTFDFVTDLKKSVHQPHEPNFDTTDFRSQWRPACAKLRYGIYNPETTSIADYDPTISVARQAET